MESTLMTPSENPLRVGLRRERGVEPCTLVIFGASGDLTQRKLVPALYNLHLDRLWPSAFAVVGVARRELPSEAFADALREGVRRHSRRELDPAIWDRMAPSLSYVASGTNDLGGLAAHLDRLDRERGTGGNRLFYLALPPSAVPEVVRCLAAANLHRPGVGGRWSRIVLEKPIGRDLASAHELNRAVNAVFAERDVFRIDHYLGKETVQNLLVFRFANAIFEPLWNHKYVDHVQLTVAESIGVEGRGAYFEEAGMLRDVVQNHMFQLLCLVAMEPPVSLDADSIRDEKVKVLQALREAGREEVGGSAVLAQYAAGVVGGDSVPGYLEEPDVVRKSRTETYAALRLFVDNWRWGGVPFYLRAGKRLTKRVTEIALCFHGVPHRLFEHAARPNTLALRIQPDEGITLRFETKVPGPQPRTQPVSMEFRYGTSFGRQPADAYERLILDALLGDSTLFIRRDEVEASWAHVDALREAWSAGHEGALPQYAAGSWGPAEAQALLARDGRAWRRL